MNHHEVVLMAQKSGFLPEFAARNVERLERFATAVIAHQNQLLNPAGLMERAFLAEHNAEKEKAARQAAQAENADLKAKLASSGVEQRRAVLAMREACAKVLDAAAALLPAKIDNQADFAALNTCLNLSRAIRALDAPPTNPAPCCSGGPQWGHSFDCPKLP